LLAKGLNISKDPWRISFEGPKLADSPIAAMTSQVSADANNSRVFNFYSDGSIYALFDERALINNRIPNYGLGRAEPRNPFETFCFTVAACGKDDRFDSLCNDVLGKQAFAAVWARVGRLRHT
jgi:hypothetical protein